MKSSDSDLRKRGLICEEDLEKLKGYSDKELILRINSEEATERTAAVRILGGRFQEENLDLIKILLKRLSIEECLYTKIEICNTLEKGEIKTAEEMIKYLGCIGKNQHKSPPKKVSKKKSYPLPRDIIARSLGRMDCCILPLLFNVLDSEDNLKISEAIDAIGFSLFYNEQYAYEDFYEKIIDTLKKYRDNDLIVCKCLCCLSAFRMQNTVDFLREFLNKSDNYILNLEAERSLHIICGN